MEVYLYWLAELWLQRLSIALYNCSVKKGWGVVHVKPTSLYILNIVNMADIITGLNYWNELLD